MSYRYLSISYVQRTKSLDLFRKDSSFSPQFLSFQHTSIINLSDEDSKIKGKEEGKFPILFFICWLVPRFKQRRESEVSETETAPDVEGRGPWIRSLGLHEFFELGW